MKPLINFLIIFLLFQTTLTAQSFKERFESIDIKHYNLSLSVNDSTNSIDATVLVSLKFKKINGQFELDLVNKDSLTGMGMVIDSIYQNNVKVDFTHTNNKVSIQPKHPFPGVKYTYTIKYSGIPKDGLVISNNLYGDRTFFGDNWPNRAHNWFPCIDHPSDKATIEYFIKAPNYYQAIANGYLVEESNIDNKSKLYHWKTEVPIPTKVMVIGVAKFAVQNIGETNNIPVSTWVYPQTKEKGFHDFSTAKKILDFYIETIGEYPFLKLANVQSNTRYGGMENAGNIFYFQESVTGNLEHENLIAHEIAHQWFGNSASEIDWPHVWLSEGFATYFTNLYIEKFKGEEAFLNKLKNQRSTVLNYFKRVQTPVIDTKTKDYIKLLNANSYQKGAWVLHMLRNELGDEIFWKGIKAYYQKYKFNNASTTNFKNVMAQTSNKNLDVFFTQWLQKSGHPVLKSSWIYFNGNVRIMIDQTQDTLFEFPLELELVHKDGSSEIKTIKISDKSSAHIVPATGEIKEIKFDPKIKLLFEHL